MSNFWSQVAAAPAAAPAPVAGYSPSPFFAPPQPFQAPSQAPAAVEAPEVPGQWGSIAASTAKAQSSRLTQTCPECNSGNFFAPHGQPNMMPVCYNCGYNPRFSQMTAGGGLPSDSSAPARPAKQMNSKGTSNFQPQNIIGRIK